ncbi:hypothetical protein B7R21_14620 [Subtercola boreus]|uniref:Glycosyltransferase n=1 Tax=Subtercola boreus TaxID=120213 RepID=A0A3E0VDH7_9MICO|nr:glycosyltransferase [Subtercola boreus]RFA07430.1 hypothetical protein B7R21_14620 [Subtercola boreus]
MSGAAPNSQPEEAPGGGASRGIPPRGGAPRGIPPRGIPLRGNDWSPLDGRTPAEPPSISVIVAHYNQQAELDRTLAALSRQTHPADRTEVIVVDDGSIEPPRVPPGVRVLRQDDRGFRLAAARNLGAGSAGGDILCFLDADTAPEPGYLDALTRLPALSPDVVAVGLRRHSDFTGLSVDAPVEIEAPPRELPSPEWLQRAYADSLNLLVSDDRSYRFIIGAVIACSRVLFEEVGGFDETFTEYGGEDWEWAHRAWTAGAVFAHVPAAVAWHDGPEWAGREGDTAGLAQKNIETLALAARIPVAGSRPSAIRLGGDVMRGTSTEPGSGAMQGTPARVPTTDVLVSIHTAPSLAALVICVDTVLQAIPGAIVRVPAAFTAALASDDRIGPLERAVSSRLTVEVPVAVRFDVPELRAAVERVTVEQLGSLELTDGSRIALLTSQRALSREARWGRHDLFPHLSATCSARPLADEPGLAAYFGGWG